MLLKFSRHSRSVIYSWIVSYVILSLVTVTLTMAVYIVARHTIEEEINNSNQLLLKNAQGSIDALLSEVNDLSLDILADPNIQVVSSLTPNDTAYYYKLYKAARSLEKYKFFKGTYLGVYLHLNNLDRVVCPGYVNFSEDYYQNNIQTPEYSYTQWRQVVGGLHYGSYATLPFKSTSGEKKMECTFIRTVSPFSVIDIAANLVIVMDMRNLLQFNANDRNLVVLDGQNTIIAQSQPEITFNQQLMDDLPPDASTFVDASTNDKKIISYIASSNSDWKYAMITSESVYWNRSWFIRNVIWGELILCVLGMSILSFYFVRRNYRVLKEVTSFVRLKVPQQPMWNCDEFLYIRQALSRSVEESEKASEMLDKQTLALQTTLLVSLLEGKPLSVPLNEMLETCKLLFPYPNFSVAIFSIKDLNTELWYSGENKNFDAYFVAKYAVQNVATEVLNRSRQVYFVEMWGLQWCIINTPETSKNFVNILELDLMIISDFLAQKLDVDLCIAVGGIHNSPVRLSLAYNEAQNAIDYEQAWGNGQIVFYDNLEATAKCTVYPKEREQHLANHLYQGDLDSASKVIQELFYPAVGNAPLSENVRLNALMLMINTLYILNDQYQCGRMLPENRDIVWQVIKCRSSTELEKLLMYFCANNLVAMSDNVQEPPLLGTAIRAFVLENYNDSALCITSIAQHLNKSPYYISKSFRQEVGEGILEFINRIRVDRAKELLKQEHLTQEQIAEKVGFSNIRTFQRIFKKVEGVPPGRLRRRPETV